MCICINCNFYRTCWINKGLLNYPSNYVYFYNNWQNLYELIKLGTVNNSTTYVMPLLHIELNINLQNSNREADIVFCDTFIENPGNWLK
jgi:hypothetical protein